MATNTGRRTYDTPTSIRSTWAKDMVQFQYEGARKISRTSVDDG